MKSLIAGLLVGLCLNVCAAEGKTWAVVVGIDDYVKDSIPDLRYATADAKLFAQALGELLQVPKEQMFVFTTDGVDPSLSPTRINLIYRLDWLRKTARPEDRVIFYFAGHGANLDSESFLLTEESDNRTIETLKASALGTRDLAGLLQRAPASQTLTILDACRNDPGKSKPSPENDRMPQLVIGGANQECAGLFSCSLGQRSWEWDDKKHGFFTYYLVQGMQGGAIQPDGQVTLESLSHYLATEVPTSTRQHIKESQVPYVYYVGTSARNWVLASGMKSKVVDRGLVPKLDASAARIDLLSAQKADLEARLRSEEARRQEVESRLALLEQKMSPASPTEEIQKLTLERDLALKELLQARKQIEDSRLQLASRGGPSVEAELILAEREQLKAENRLLQARISVLEAKLQQGGVSLARSLTVEEKPSEDISGLLSQSQKLRQNLSELVDTADKSHLARKVLESEKEQLQLQGDLAAAQMQLRIWQNRVEQANLAQQTAEIRLQQSLQASQQPDLPVKESEALRQAEQRFQQARRQNHRLIEEWKIFWRDSTFRRRVISSRYYQINGPAGMGDILDLPVGPQLQELP